MRIRAPRPESRVHARFTLGTARAKKIDPSYAMLAAVSVVAPPSALLQFVNQIYTVLLLPEMISACNLQKALRAFSYLLSKCF